MKKIFLCFIISSTFLLNGCFNYNDIDKVLFATAVIVDVDNTGNPIIYVEAFKPTRGGKAESGKGERVLFKGTGKTIFEIVRDLNLSASNKINYTQNRGVIFTEKAAEKDLEDFIDFFSRGQEQVVRSDISIFKGDPQKLITTKLKEQEYIGLFVHDLIYNIPNSSRAVILNLNDFFNKSYSASHTAVVPIIALKEDQPESKIEISNAAIIRDFKMVGSIDRREGEGYNFLIDNIKGGTLEVSNPDADGSYVTLEILTSKTSTKVYYDGNIIHVKKVIHTRTAIAGVQRRFKFTDTTIKQSERNAESNIKIACNKIFEEYKKKKIDVFDISDDFHRRYPKEKLDNIMGKSQLELEVHVFIEGSPDTTDFRSY